MTPILIVLVLLALGVGIVVWAVRKKPSATTTGPREADTAWNDPVTPGEPARPSLRPDAFADAAPPATSPSQEPRP